MRPLAILGLFVLAVPAFAQEQRLLPPPSSTATIVIDHGASNALVTAAAFSPDGNDLYTGGLDKVVRRYRLVNGQFVLNATYPVPIGPGNAGVVNALAVSPDGKWVAVAGRAPFREEATFGELSTVVVDTSGLSAEAKQDYGVVYLIDPTNNAGGRVLRGQRGEVRALAFAQPNPAGGPVLVTAGLEWVAPGKRVGSAHAFSVATGKQLASLSDLPSTPTRPGLGAWPAGNGANDVRVAMAWPNADGSPGQLRVWDVATGKSDPYPEGRFNTALLVRDGEVWSSSLTTAGQIAIRPKAGLGNGTQVSLAKVNGMNVLARALAGGGPTLAGLMEIASDGKTPVRPMELRLFDAAGQAKASALLTGFTRSGPLPALTVSGDGRFVAVCGFPDNRIEIYDAAAKPVQRISGIVGGFTKVAFVTGNNLWVGGAGETPDRGGVAFDFAARTAQPNPGKLAVEAPKDGGAVIYSFDAAKSSVTLTIGGKDRDFALRPGEVPTAAVLLPGGALAAVAHTDRDELVTLVSLFDTASGRRVRQLVGPVQDIAALAVSGNGQLLAGVSGDRTASVWTLKDLGKEQGAIDGLIVTGRDKQVIVTTVEAGSPAVGKLAPGDVIEAVGSEKGELKAVATGHEFRNEVGARPVDSSVRVRRVRGNGAPEVVVLKVGRSLVQRDPLFTLWIDSAPNPAGLNWIGWHPTGLYDANSPASEARIGWQSSTGDPAQPAVIAGIGQFRKLFYKRTILEHLAAKADLAEAIGAIPPPQEPKLVVGVVPVETPEGLRLVRTKNATLRLSVSDPDGMLWLNRAAIRWRATGPDGVSGPWQQVRLQGQSTIEVPLADYPWKRGAHRFQAELLMTPESNAALEDGASVAFVPPTPELVVQIDGKVVEHNEELSTTKNDSRVSVSVKPGTGSGDVEVQLVTTSPGAKDPVQFATLPNGGFAPRDFALDPKGNTVFKFTARNRGAAENKDTAHLEVHEPKVYVRHVPLKPAPRIRLRLASAADAPTRDGKPYVVDATEVALEAAVDSEEKIASLEWDLGDGKFVAGKVPAAGKTADNSLTLPADNLPRTIKVRVVTESKQESTRTLDVVYAPLPKLDFPGLPDSVTSGELAVEGRFGDVPPKLLPRVKLVIASDVLGQSREIPVRLDPATKTWRPAEEVTLFPGANRIGLVVNNDYKERRDPNVGEVHYRRPPLVLGVQPLDAGTAAVGELSATVATPRGLAPQALLVNGTPVDSRPPKPMGSLFGIDLWNVRVDAVPVRIGDAWLNQVHLAVRNGDGERGPVAVAVRRVQNVPPPPPPTIVVTRGPDRILAGQSIATNQPRFAFGLRIASNAALLRVALWHQAGPQSPLEQVPGVDPRRALAVADGFDLHAAPEIELREGVNRIRIVAANAGDGASVEFTVTYAPPPVRIVIESIDEVPGGGAQPLPLGAPGSGQPVVAETAFVNIRGKVVWTADDSPLARAGDLSIVLTANQVVHFPAELRMPEAGKKERAFAAPLFLNAAQTRVKVEVRSRSQIAVPQQGIGPAEVELSCRAPLTEQRLHIVVIAPDVITKTDEAKLVRDVLAAVGGEAPQTSAPFRVGEFKHRTFTRAILYAPLVASVTPSDIAGRLAEVEGGIKQSMARPGQKWVNDVVLVYYQGRDRIGKTGMRLLATSQTRPYPEGKGEHTMVRVDALERTPGVHVIVLNVANPGQVPVPPDALTADPLQLRYPWKDAAATAELLPLFGRAVAKETTLGGIVALVEDNARSTGKLAADPTVALPPEVGRRPFSDK